MIFSKIGGRESMLSKSGHEIRTEQEIRMNKEPAAARAIDFAVSCITCPNENKKKTKEMLCISGVTTIAADPLSYGHDFAAFHLSTAACTIFTAASLNADDAVDVRLTSSVPWLLT